MPYRDRPTLERADLLAALRAANGNRSEAARRLDVSRATLYREMRRHGVVLAVSPVVILDD